MHAEMFIENFDVLVAAPGGLAKLRSLILALAMRGMLTAQQDGDDSAAALESSALRIVSAKTRKHFAEFEAFHSIPSHWKWVRLGAISTYSETTKVEPDTNLPPETWVLELEDIEKETSALIRRVVYQDRNFQSTKNYFEPGYVLYGKLRPYLDKVLVADQIGVCTTEIIPFKPLAGICPHFIRWCLKSPDFISYADNATHGMSLPRLGTPAAINAPMPLPPLAEQRRVVAKVDELMALCDHLEVKMRESDRLSDQLFAALANKLNDDGTGGGNDPPTRKRDLSVENAPDSPPELKQSAVAVEAPPAKMAQETRQSLPIAAAPVDTKFQEAALVGAIVKSFFADGGEPIGNFRLQKAVYFARRHNADPSATADFLKKAAGPYNPSMKYSGGIAIAKAKSYITEARGRYGFGHIPGATIAELEPAVERYGYGASATWVNQHFKFKKNEEWELLATVDYAMLQVRDATPADILAYVANDPEWRPKIEKLGLTEFKIESAMLEIRALFPNANGSA